MKNALTTLRREVSDIGFDVYMVGDQAYYIDFIKYRKLKAHVELYDAITAYSLYSSDEKTLRNYENLNREFSFWSKKARRLGVPFIPAVMPGFDYRLAYWETWNIQFYLNTRTLHRIDIAKNLLDDNLRALFMVIYLEILR